MFTRWIEDGLTDVLQNKGVGCIAFSPLAGGLLTNRYIAGIPADSRVGNDPRYMKPHDLTEERLTAVKKLNEIAIKRNQSLAQMSLAWVLRDSTVTSALIGASRPEQVIDNVRVLDAPTLTAEELTQIDTALH
jgi:L-glyceraldehyde 3-phosphate reductase